MTKFSFPTQVSWEEIASEVSANTTDTEKLMIVMTYVFESGTADKSDIPSILAYFRRARWAQPSNLAATANHCAGKGWLTEVGQADSKKLWAITRKGYEAFKSKATTETTISEETS